MTIEIFVFLDLFLELPMGVDENFVHQMSQAGEQPHIPMVNTTTFTQALVPRLVIPFKYLIASLDQGLVDIVMQDPEAFLAIILFRAGPKLFKANSTLSAKIALFLESLVIGANNFDISEAV